MSPLPPDAPRTTAAPRAQNPAPRTMAAMRVVFRCLSAVSPSAAARAGVRLFFGPRRTAPRADERAVLARARRTEHRVMGERVVSHAWGSGPAVLLVHGWSGHAAHMAAFVDPLVAAGFRVVAADMPGHGASAGRMSSIVHFAAAMEQLARDHLGGAAGEWHGIIAHSFGTPGTLWALTQGVRARGVVAVAPPAHLGRLWVDFQQMLGVGDEVLSRMRRMSEARLGIRFDDAEPLRLAPRMRMPLLVIHDRSDREVGVAEGVALAAAWPGAVLHQTDGLGHVRILRDAECVRLATGFIRGPQAPGSAAAP